MHKLNIRTKKSGVTDDQVALFQERILPQDREDRKIPIYNSRACYFFMNKMAVEGEYLQSIL